MTEEQVLKWQARRDAARRIEDPVAREHALDIVYDLKDDMQLDCQRKLADRIKELVSSAKEQRKEIFAIKESVASVKQDLARHEKEFNEDHAAVEEFREHKLRAHGVMLALKWLGYIVSAGGGAGLAWILAVVNKASGVQ